MARREGIAVLGDQTVGLFRAWTRIDVLNDVPIDPGESHGPQDVQGVHDLLDEPPHGGRHDKGKGDGALGIEQPGRTRHERVHRGRARVDEIGPHGGVDRRR